VKIGDLGLAAILQGSQSAHSVIGTYILVNDFQRYRLNISILVVMLVFSLSLGFELRSFNSFNIELKSVKLHCYYIYIF